MSVASIGTTRRMELSEYVDECDPRVFRGRVDRILDDLFRKANSIGMKNKRAIYEKCRVPWTPSILGIVTVTGEVEVAG